MVLDAKQVYQPYDYLSTLTSAEPLDLNISCIDSASDP